MQVCSTTLPPVVSRSPATAAPRHASDTERELFERLLGDFVPAEVFDVHAHAYLTDHGPALPDEEPHADLQAWAAYTRAWMGGRSPAAGLFFGFPVRGVDPAADNRWLADQLTHHPGSRGLLLVRPQDDPQAVEARVAAERWAGFKVYHVYADRSDTFNAGLDEYVPQWVWRLAHERELVIMLHLVRRGALADAGNQRLIRERCLRYRGVKLILAHAARGFCADHTLDGLEGLAGLDNVYFDTSAVCESAALTAILQRFGTSRLMYGSDFPVSQFRGRHVSLGDHFFWLYDANADFDEKLGKPVLVGIESLLALRQAARLSHLNDSDLERIFSGNALQLLGLVKPANNLTSDRYRQAQSLIPGGTQLLSKRPEMFAPGHWPAYFTEAHGVEVIDLDRRRYIDMSIAGIGSTLLGFADPDVNAAVTRRVMLGSMSTLNPADEVELAELLIELHPWAEQVRYTRTGGEAMAVAVRIARAAAGRDRAAFCGYHGWSDWYLAANLSTSGGDRLHGHLLPGLEPRGVPSALADTALPFTYNRLDQLEAIVKQHGDDLAAIVMEPTRHQPPAPGFLEGVRELADRCGACLIFDEITTGWRFERGGVHLRYAVSPDMAVFSKALGNGFPIAAVLGIRRVMDAAQHSFISSTMWTEALGPAAALATIRKLIAHDVVTHVDRIGRLFQEGLRAAAERHGVPLRVGGPPCLTQVGFEHPDAAALLTFYTRLLLERGLLAGGGFYPTLAHQLHHVDEFLQAADKVLAVVAEAIECSDVTRRIEGKVKHAGFARLT